MPELIWPEHMPLSVETVWPNHPPRLFRTTVKQGRAWHAQGNAEPNRLFHATEEGKAGYLLGFYNPQASEIALWRFYVAHRKQEQA